MSRILGISAFHHDSAAALVVDRDIIAPAQEERFTRKKHDHEFPVHAIRDCLDEAAIGPAQLDYTGFYDKPFLKLERPLDTYLSYAPRGFRSFFAIRSSRQRRLPDFRHDDRSNDHGGRQAHTSPPTAPVAAGVAPVLFIRSQSNGASTLKSIFLAIIQDIQRAISRAYNSSSKWARTVQTSPTRRIRGK